MSTGLLLIGAGLVVCSSLGSSVKRMAWSFWALGVGLLIVGFLLKGIGT